MTIKLNYVLPMRDMLVFSHLKTNKLTVVIDTRLVETEEDILARIADEILREYAICLTVVHTAAIPRWPEIRTTIMNDVIKERRMRWK